MEGSDRRWRKAISGGGERWQVYRAKRSEVEGSGRRLGKAGPGRLEGVACRVSLAAWSVQGLSVYRAGHGRRRLAGALLRVSHCGAGPGLGSRQ